jgi:hypothetical protein
VLAERRGAGGTYTLLHDETFTPRGLRTLPSASRKCLPWMRTDMMLQPKGLGSIYTLRTSSSRYSRGKWRSRNQTRYKDISVFLHLWQSLHGHSRYGYHDTR